jgi:predicted DNA-binding transcriptional regulator AlpA
MNITGSSNSPSQERTHRPLSSENGYMLQQRPDDERTRHGSPLSELSDECLITSKSVKEICGSCSDMHIWRLLNEEKYRALAFPRPIKINRRKYWRLGAVRRWIRERESNLKQIVRCAEVQGDRRPCTVAGASPTVKQPRGCRFRAS